MSVPVHKRHESKMEFFHNYEKLKKEIIFILMRDFGVKARSYTLDLVGDIYKISDEDMKTMEEIHEKYDITSYDVKKYPEWLLNAWRGQIMDILCNMGIELNCANCIYPTNIFEYYNRRNHWNAVIGYCYALLNKTYEITSCIKVKLGAYVVAIELIEKEIKLVKGIRKSDNKYINNLRQNELPYFNNQFFSYRYYPNDPHAPNYCLNSSNLVGDNGGLAVREMCCIVDKSTHEHTSVVTTG